MDQPSSNQSSPDKLFGIGLHLPISGSVTSAFVTSAMFVEDHFGCVRITSAMWGPLLQCKDHLSNVSGYIWNVRITSPQRFQHNAEDHLCNERISSAMRGPPLQCPKRISYVRVKALAVISSRGRWCRTLLLQHKLLKVIFFVDKIVGIDLELSETTLFSFKHFPKINEGLVKLIACFRNCWL